MRKIKLYTFISLDGFVARTNGDVDWISQFKNHSKTDYGYKKFIDSVDTIIIDGDAYDGSLELNFPYIGKETYIVSVQEKNITLPKNANLITGNIIQKISLLKEKKGKDIWLIGGGELITISFNAGLIDEMEIVSVPIILGIGIPFFSFNLKETTCILQESKVHENGIMNTKYLLTNSTDSIIGSC